MKRKAALFISILFLFSNSYALSQEKENSTTTIDTIQRKNIVSLAKKQIGTSYRYGGTSPQEGFDCSGLIYYCYGNENISLPRSSKEQYKRGKAISLDQAQPGDIVAFYSPVTHVGILISKDRFIHARNSAASVEIGSLKGYWGKKLSGVVTYFKE